MIIGGVDVVTVQNVAGDVPKVVSYRGLTPLEQGLNLERRCASAPPEVVREVKVCGDRVGVTARRVVLPLDEMCFGNTMWLTNFEKDSESVPAHFKS